MLGDTIFAIASPPGPAPRGVLRLSGPQALAAATAVLQTPPVARRGSMENQVKVAGRRLPCLVLVMPGPHSYTGEDVVELHLLGAPLLLEALCQQFRPHARLATPGEFTRRAFEHGRMALDQAEAVLQLIHAASVEEGRLALGMLRGGLAQSVQELRQQIQDALAWLESGLDFGEEETGTVSIQRWLPGLQQARQECQRLLAALPQSRVAGEILVYGAANAGKSSLCNALAGGQHSLVADLAGTTRDVLAVHLSPDLCLLDSPGDLQGDQAEAAALDQEMLALRDRLAQRAAAILWVMDPADPNSQPPALGLPVLARVLSKADLAAAELPPSDLLPSDLPTFHVSSVTGQGLAELRAFLQQHAATGPVGMGSRVHDLLAAAGQCLATAVAAAEEGQPEEMIAVDLSAALQSLDAIHGQSSPEDLLDRIFQGFCLGK